MLRHVEKEKFVVEETERKENMLNEAIMDMVNETERENQESARKERLQEEKTNIKQHNTKVIRKTVKEWNKLIKGAFDNDA